MDPLLHSFLVTTGQHRLTKIHGDDLSTVSQVTGKGQCEIGGTAADIEGTRARRYPTDGDCLLAPVVVQAKAQHRVENIIMLRNRGKHLPHSVSHSLPLLLTSDIVIDESRHIMGNDRSQVQLPCASGMPIPALHRCKENHMTIVAMWAESRRSESFSRVLALSRSDGGIARTEKEVQKLKLNLH